MRAAQQCQIEDLLVHYMQIPSRVLLVCCRLCISHSTPSSYKRRLRITRFAHKNQSLAVVVVVVIPPPSTHQDSELACLLVVLVVTGTERCVVVQHGTYTNTIATHVNTVEWRAAVNSSMNVHECIIIINSMRRLYAMLLLLPLSVRC